jgi:molybdate transport system substrate-binding protein
MRGMQRHLVGMGLMVCLVLASPAVALAEPVKVFAAASLKNALDAVGAAWSAKDKSKSIAATYAASSALAKQIEAGAPADIFISADLDWMDYLLGKSLIKSGTQHTILGNTLVLVAPAGSGVKLELKPGVDIAAALGGGKIAICDVKAVPAGKYAKAALEKLGLWAAVAPNIAQSENVRAALAFVARSEAKLGVVYATDAKVEPKVEVVATFPDDSHPPIVYPDAAIATSTNPDNAAFLDFLASDEAKAIFVKQGFRILQ